MKKVILFFILFLGLTGIGHSQNVQDAEPIKSSRKAECLKEDLVKFLANNTKYPLGSLEKNIQGDVVLSFMISKEGKLNNLKVVSSPDISLSTSSVSSLSGVANEWKPCETEGKPIDKDYLLVFRYRIYRDTQPFDYQEKIEKLVDKLKYEKALKLTDDAIKDNPYNFKFYETRSGIRNSMGDAVGSKKDAEQSYRVQNEIYSYVDVVALGITRVVTRTIETRIETRQVN